MILSSGYDFTLDHCQIQKTPKLLISQTPSEKQKSHIKIKLKHTFNGMLIKYCYPYLKLSVWIFWGTSCVCEKVVFVLAPLGWVYMWECNV